MGGEGKLRDTSLIAVELRGHPGPRASWLSLF
jgi:hypothetical protein